ncbi:MAG: tripartite tricarboxylate transporter substrate binding protein [Betaproteobacteria bacterium]|nr:tripartite tricarboxylate transporter substrate binding protein [Betaproteobacteria bacterium]MBI3056611.1 tripartite tricarboxylate transporter substrate binding protein [Betaproteobacteria bacterium]
MTQWMRAFPVLAALVLYPAVALGQGTAAPGLLPNKTMQIIVPNAPGGGPDFIARLIAPKLREVFGQNVVVDNRPSNNGIVATEFLARAVADGSIIGFGNAGTHAINATLYKKLSYDPVRDFAAISEIASASMVLVTNPKLAANSVRELIAEAKQAPGRLIIAVAGATGEVAGNALKLQAGIEMNNVNYKGGVPAVIAIISGDAHMTLTNYTAVAKQVEAGRLKLLAVTGARRALQLPNVPTFAENGLDGYDHSLWYGLFAPAKTPPAVVQAYYREVARIISLPEVRERLVATGHEVIGSTPEQFTDKVKREVEKFRKIILESGMQQD